MPVDKGGSYTMTVNKKSMAQVLFFDVYAALW